MSYSTIAYQDEFDVENYPITESDKEFINSIDVCFEWDYIATIHGKIFVAKSPRHFELVHIKHIAEFTRLRWVSINEYRIDSKDFSTVCKVGFLNSIALEASEFSIGLTHDK
jgi:hypothetical protein